MKKFLIALVMLLGMGANAHAGIIITFDDDGTGMTRATINGTYDVTGLNPAGSAAPSDGFFVNGFPNLFLVRRTAPTLTNNFSLAFADPGNPATAFINSSFTSEPSHLTVDNFGILFQANLLQIQGYDANVSGTLNETLNYTNTPFSSFNTGTWNFGGGSSTLNGATVSIGATAVPEPSSMLLFASGAIGLVFCRRRRQQIS